MVKHYLSHYFIIYQVQSIWNHLKYYVYCRELSEVEAKLDAMEENSRQMTILERQQMEAQALVDRAKHEINEAELIHDIDRAKFASLFSTTC